MHLIDLPNVQTSVSTHNCMRLRGRRKGKHGPVTSPAQIEVVTRRALVPVARDGRIARRTKAWPFPALLCIPDVSGHVVVQEYQNTDTYRHPPTHYVSSSARYMHAAAGPSAMEPLSATLRVHLHLLEMSRAQVMLLVRS